MPPVLAPYFKGNTEQLYTIDIKTKAGCITTDTQLVKLVKSVEIFVPNAFTPNGDGINDDLKPTFFGVKQMHYFRIYNRWGTTVLSNIRSQKKDGMVHLKVPGRKCKPWCGALEALGVDGVIYTKRGTTILVR